MYFQGSPLPLCYRDGPPATSSGLEKTTIHSHHHISPPESPSRGGGGGVEVTLRERRSAGVRTRSCRR